MKRIAALLGISLLVISSAFVTTQIGQGSPPDQAGGITLTISDPLTGFSDAEGFPGTQLSMAVRVEGANDMAGLQFDVAYDADVVTVDRVTLGELPHGIFFQANTGNPGSVRIALAGSSGLEVETLEVATITFNIQGGSGQVTPLTFSGVVAGDGSVPPQPIPATAVDGSITVLSAGSSADLSLTKIDLPDPVVVGSELVYNLVVTNSVVGAVATAAHLTDELPSEVSFSSATTTRGNCSQSLGIVSCDLGDLEPGGRVDVRVVVTPTSDGEITNVAEVSSNVADLNPDNNSASEVTTVIPECTLELTSNYDGKAGTMTLEVLIGSVTPATLDLWGTSQGSIIPIVTAQPVPAIDIPVTRSFTQPIASMGVIGFLATMTTPEDNITCLASSIVDTGGAP